MQKLIHISDLHFGRLRQDVAENLLHDSRIQNADLICVSGDLTQRAKDRQFSEASRFLAALKPPKIVVPGNHDVPLWNVFKRFFDPFGGYRKHISAELDPYYSVPGLYVQGLNTARSFTISGGRIRDEQLHEMYARIERLPSSTVKVIVGHHPVDFHEVAKFKIDLYLFGHLHLAHAEASHEFHDEPHHSAVLVRAGTTTSTRVRGEANSFNSISLDGGALRVAHYCYSEDSRAFETRSERVYLKKTTGWHRT